MEDARPAWWEVLDEGDLQFLKRFVLSSGSLKALCDEYGVSYPTLRARRLPELSLPPLLVAVVALALAAAVLFALPGILGFGSPSAVSSPSPSSPAASGAAQTFAPTPVPQPTQQVYIVQSGDTMSRIAKKFHLALADLIAANAENIPNPDRLQIGDQVIIPVPVPSELPAATGPASS